MLHQRTTAYRLPLALLLCASALSLSCSSGGSVFDRAENNVPGASQPKQLSDYDVAMLDAPAVKLSQMVGKDKVVVVDFWATWCGPCRMAVPHLSAIQRDYGAKGVEVIGLSLEDPRADAEKVRAFAKELAINYRLGFSSQEMFAAFNGADPRMPIPQTFVFGRDGQLVPGGHIKGSHPRLGEMMKELVEKALKS